MERGGVSPSSVPWRLAAPLKRCVEGVVPMALTAAAMVTDRTLP
jgi:hypothetical protein